MRIARSFAMAAWFILSVACTGTSPTDTPGQTTPPAASTSPTTAGTPTGFHTPAQSTPLPTPIANAVDTPSAWHVAAGQNGFAAPVTCAPPEGCEAPPCECPIGCGGGWCRAPSTLVASAGISPDAEDPGPPPSGGCALMAGEPVCFSSAGDANYGDFLESGFPTEGQRWVQLMGGPYDSFYGLLCGLGADGVSNCGSADFTPYRQITINDEPGQPSQYTCGIKVEDATVDCFGDGVGYVEGALPGTYVHLSHNAPDYDGDARLCGVNTDGDIVCVGPEGCAVTDGGDCSERSTPAKTGPRTVFEGQGPFVQVDTHILETTATCGLKASGTIVCEGVAAPQGGTYHTIALDAQDDAFRLCAVDASGQLTCWLNGEVEPQHSGAYTQVALGPNVGCALNPEGQVDCFRDSDGWAVGASPWEGPFDNCPGAHNADQADMDSDGIGDVCDDSDGDGVVDAEDNCPLVPNGSQDDCDGDGIGDPCDDTSDVDEDGVIATCDNCPDAYNPGQANSDAQVCLGGATYCEDDIAGCFIDVSSGKTCADVCPDNPDSGWGCPITYASEGGDGSCGVGDETYVPCDEAIPEEATLLRCICAWAEDGPTDSIGDSCDNCPRLANGDQADADGDGRGDVCD